MGTLLVLTNLPDRAAAERLADTLVAKNLAACVTILAPCRSVSRGKGAVQAFRFSARAVDDGAVEVRFAIADGYYLYRDRLRFSAEGKAQLGQPQLPAGIPHKDEFFGEMPIYRGSVSIRLPVQGEGRFDL